MKTEQWGAYYTGAPTPFDSDGALDKKALAAQLRYFIDSGVSGILMNGFTGEWFSMSREERRQALDVAVQTAAGQVPVVAFVGSTSLRETLELIGDAEKGKADAVGVTPASGANHDPKGIMACYQQWCARSKLPVMLYNLPSEIANNLTLEIIEKLAVLPNVVAMKDVPSELNQSIRTAVGLGGKKLRLFGSYMDRVGIQLIHELKVAHGYLGSGMLFGQWMAEFFRKLEKNDVKGATEICDKVAAFNARLFGSGYGHYWALVKLVTDIQAGTRTTARLPIVTITDKKIESGVRALLAEFGVNHKS